MKRYLLGVDNGGTYIKAALFDINGKQCYLEKLLSMADNDGYGCSERNQQMLWENNCKCIRNLLAKVEFKLRRLRGLLSQARVRDSIAWIKTAEIFVPQ